MANSRRLLVSKGREFLAFIVALSLSVECAEAFSHLPPRKALQSMMMGRNRHSPCFLSPTDVLDSIGDNKAVADLVEGLPPPLSENPALVVGGAGLATAAALASALLVPPSRLLSDKALENVVEGTYIGQQLQRRPSCSLVCSYKASRDGWSASVFHEKVDGLGSGVVVAKAALGGAVFGGFNPNGWRSTDDYSTATSAFLWCLQSGGSSKVIKYSILPSSASLFDYATSGPCFGATDLVIGPPQAAVMGGFSGPQMEDDSLSSGNLRQAKVLPGQAYDTDTSWPVRGYNVRLQEVEVYCLSND